MIELKEVKPLPQVCQECQEVKEWGVECACYNCDHALERFEMITVDDPRKLS